MTHSTDKNPRYKWQKRDFLLVLDLYFREGMLPETDIRVIELAKLIPPSPGSINARLANYVARDPKSGRKGLSGGGKDAGKYLDEYYDRRKELSQLCEAIKADLIQVAAQPDDHAILFDGPRRSAQTYVYDRNQKAKDICKKHYGMKCFVCDFDFEMAYGKIGEGFIHVHHLRPLSEGKEQSEIDPIKGLRPVCPNCHAILHRDPKNVLSINQLKSKVKFTVNYQ